MKILTLWQPYASLIAFDQKGYETRHWATQYRGPIAIHAAKRKMTDDDLDLWNTVKGVYAHHLPPAESLPMGAVIAIAELTGCEEMRCHNGLGIINSHHPSELEEMVGHWEDGRFAWNLENVQRLSEPIEWMGAQGLRDVQPKLAEKIAIAKKVPAWQERH